MNTVLKRSAIMVSLLVIAVLGTVFATRVSFAEDFYTIKIEYKYSGGSNAHDPYVAVLRGGEDLDVEVTNPVIPGYRPMDSPEPDANEVRTIDLKYTDIHESDTITVYYLPDKVHYKVRYFMQNIRDDLYTEDLSLSNDYYEKSGYTGTFPDELEHIEFEGFTSLFHEPDAIAADGSTEFKLYYDRNYYLVSFDLGEGGYGVEPVYAKHGTNYTISDINYKKLYAVVYAKQSAKKVYANYRLNSTDAYTPIQTTVGANRNTQKELAALDMRGAENFSYWAIRKSADERASVIAKCYDPWFSFCIMDNYWISPVFEDAENPTMTAKLNPDAIKTGEEDWLAWTWSEGKDDGTLVTPSYDLTFTGLKDKVVFARVEKGTTEFGYDWCNVWNQTDDLTVTDGATFKLTGWGTYEDKKMYGEWSEAAQKSIILTHLGYFRNRWTDESGNIAANGTTDLLYTDFEIAFSDGQTQIYGADSGYKTGVVLELCGKFEGETFNPADYNYLSDEAKLKEAILNGKVSVYNYDSSDSTKRRSIQISEISTEKLTNRNRVEFFKGYRNTYKEKDGVKTYTNKTYIMKATAYLIDPDGNVTLSNSEYVCLTDIAAKNMAVNAVSVSSD